MLSALSTAKPPLGKLPGAPRGPTSLRDTFSEPTWETPHLHAQNGLPWWLHDKRIHLPM